MFSSLKNSSKMPLLNGLICVNILMINQKHIISFLQQKYTNFCPETIDFFYTISVLDLKLPGTHFI